ncbi:oxidoreductase [Parvularcula bermudensis HTCC2503]|uniref:2-oxoglutarate-dependent ethylene/succinate-forming enzyme n=1 Tax=Parvularcula bermudensis (strain ATCC BAA-594 / HTCC2503 / KCTC 12087) TaxID=314260 RepID=E0TE70_PARBH|nr:2-oxoglutarate and iron-dependent oxygenase domain-containing protein [Parvularcula bermudensis]ADM09445.1 oxidoreductase [Parvularcula bermudensis HTCC2503]
MADPQTLSFADALEGDRADRAAFASALVQSLKDTGFVILIDHGIDLTRLNDVYETVAAFFAQAEDDKARFIVGRDGQRGYTPFGRESAKDTAIPDLKEFWHVGREAVAPNVWPDHPPAFRSEISWLYEALDATGHGLLAALEEGLGVGAGDLTRLAEGGNSVLRLLHYPPVTATAPPGSLRAAAHEDINLITLLVAASAEGLELLSRDGEWRAIDAPPDALIVDSGDMLARLTNGFLPATTHRVVRPRTVNRSRYSLPYFLHPRPDALLACLDGFRDGSEAPPILAADFLAQRLAAIGLT